MLCPFLLFSIWKINVRNISWKNPLYFFPRFCIIKFVFWVVRFVQVNWWMSFSHVLGRCDTSSIDEFVPITASKRVETRNCTKYSPYKSGVILPCGPVVFATEFEEVNTSLVMFCYLCHIEKGFVLPPRTTSLQHTHWVVTTHQLAKLLWEWCFRPLLAQDQQERH